MNRYLLVNDHVKYADFCAGLLRIGSDSKLEPVELCINIMDCPQLEERIISPNNCELELITCTNEHLYITVPYPDKLDGNMWLRMLKVTFVMGRLKYMQSHKGNELVQEIGCQQVNKFSEIGTHSM